MPPLRRPADASVGLDSRVREARAGGAGEDARRPPGIDRDDLARLTRYLERLAASGFFGKVTVSFQNGRACDVKIEQTHKLDEL